VKCVNEGLLNGQDVSKLLLGKKKEEKKKREREREKEYLQTKIAKL